MTGRLIRVLPRAQVRDIIRHREPQAAPWALISVYSSPKEQLIGSEEEKVLKGIGCEKVLNLCVGDYDHSHMEVIKKIGKEEFVFSEEHAKNVIDFVKSFDEEHQLQSYLTMLVVHCDAGVSRSGAIGLWACRYLGCDEKEFRRDNPFIHPNTLIYETLYIESGMKESYKDFWENTIIEGSWESKIKFIGDKEEDNGKIL